MAGNSANYVSMQQLYIDSQNCGELHPSIYFPFPTYNTSNKYLQLCMEESFSQIQSHYMASLINLSR